MAASAKCSHGSLPWTWGSSSWPPPLPLDLGQLLLAAAPALGPGAAPLNCASVVAQTEHLGDIHILTQAVLTARHLLSTTKVWASERKTFSK